jgi:hypothetical protein
VILIFHAYNGAKQKRNMIQIRNNILISPSMTGCENEKHVLGALKRRISFNFSSNKYVINFKAL